MPEGPKYIPVSAPTFLGNEKKYVQDCLDTEWVSSIGKYIPAFEDAFAKFCEVPYAVACSNGTTALHLALLALELAPGDEVIVPTLTFVATANAVRYCGATPVFVDSESITMNIDASLIEAKVTPRTRGIIVVHLYGHPVEMNSIVEIARRHGLWIIEDAAEAHGARYKGRIVGSLGDVATFSFFGNKIITTGEGGMVTTSNGELARKMRLLRGQGMEPDRRYWFPIVGYNYRMTNIQAAIGLAQLENIDDHLARRRAIAGWYNEHLHAVGAPVELPIEASWATHSFWMYTILLRKEIHLTNEQFRSALSTHHIDSRPVFYPMHTMPPFFDEAPYPVAESLSTRGVSLPTHGKLTRDDVQRISDAIATVCLTSSCA